MAKEMSSEADKQKAKTNKTSAAIGGQNVLSGKNQMGKDPGRLTAQFEVIRRVYPKESLY